MAEYISGQRAIGWSREAQVWRGEVRSNAAEVANDQTVFSAAVGLLAGSVLGLLGGALSFVVWPHIDLYLLAPMGVLFGLVLGGILGAVVGQPAGHR